MKKILTGCLSVLAFFAIVKVLVAQPMDEGKMMETKPAVEVVGNVEAMVGGMDNMMNAGTVMTDEAGNMMMNEENAMEMHQEGGY